MHIYPLFLWKYRYFWYWNQTILHWGGMWYGMITEEKLLFFINNHYAEAITLDTVADSLGFSKYYVSRQFKSYMHSNFCDYLNKIRTKAAAEMLRTSDYSITDIAMRAGFQSISSFNRTFKIIYGCSPTKFRNQCMISTYSPAGTWSNAQRETPMAGFP